MEGGRERERRKRGDEEEEEKAAAFEKMFGARLFSGGFEACSDWH
jgi:hypothetical protein